MFPSIAFLPQFQTHNPPSSSSSHRHAATPPLPPSGPPSLPPLCLRAHSHPLPFLPMYRTSPPSYSSHRPHPFIPHPRFGCRSLVPTTRSLPPPYLPCFEPNTPCSPFYRPHSFLPLLRTHLLLPHGGPIALSFPCSQTQSPFLFLLPPTTPSSLIPQPTSFSSSRELLSPHVLNENESYSSSFSHRPNPFLPPSPIRPSSTFTLLCMQHIPFHCPSSPCFEPNPSSSSSSHRPHPFLPLSPNPPPTPPCRTHRPFFPLLPNPIPFPLPPTAHHPFLPCPTTNLFLLLASTPFSPLTERVPLLPPPSAQTPSSLPVPDLTIVDPHSRVCKHVLFHCPSSPCSEPNHSSSSSSHLPHLFLPLSLNPSPPPSCRRVISVISE